MARARRLSLAIRWLAFVLCLLAASPLTAPFSTLDVADLSDNDEQRPAEALQFKSAKADPVCGPGSMPNTAPFAAAVDKPAAGCTPLLASHSRIHSILRL